MTSMPTITFARPAIEKKGTAIAFALEGPSLAPSVEALAQPGQLSRAFRAVGFTGKSGSTADLLAPAESALDRIVIVGAGKAEELDDGGWLKLGGLAAAQFGKAKDISILTDLPGRIATGREAAAIALGVLMRAYAFQKYKTKKDNGEADKNAKPVHVTIRCSDLAAARKAFADAEAIASGVVFARDLVNEPANVLGPVEFAAQLAELSKLGVKVDVLTEKEMKKLGMGALLGVAQGSVRPPRLVVMQWKGGKPKDAPVAFVGKGVVFDTGGISIKPAAGMEDMKGDMGGAAAVSGLMKALAGRKARANVVGIVGLVENMPDGNAQRPGDIVTSMSGQTIEVLNTDAEGRLVLADALWYCNDRFKPKFMVNLATLTGAILVALGQSYAGLFSNNDELSIRLSAAGEATGERVWRMPMGADYDKLIDSKIADMKNIGGRNAGSITAAQFLKRFVKETPWAHLDIAAVAMGSVANETNQSWGSGWGVRLLDRLVRDHYEW